MCVLVCTSLVWWYYSQRFVSGGMYADVILCLLTNTYLPAHTHTQVRSDPAEHVRNAVDQVKMARQLTKEHHEKQMKLILLRKDVK